MHDNENFSKIHIEYKNDCDAMNKLIDFIINLLIDSTEHAGEDFVRLSNNNGGTNDLST